MSYSLKSPPWDWPRPARGRISSNPSCIQNTMTLALETDQRPRGLFLAPFEGRELPRLTDRLHVECDSWMQSKRLVDPDTLFPKLNDLNALILVIEPDFVFQEVFEAVPTLNFLGSAEPQRTMSTSRQPRRTESPSSTHPRGTPRR